MKRLVLLLATVIPSFARAADPPGLAPVPSVPATPVATAACNSCGDGCGSSIIAGSPIKAWLCFRPTTGHALPWLRPHPYVGPVTGQFGCSSNGGPTCEPAAACGANGGCGKGFGGIGGHGGLGLVGRGYRNGNGTCVTPADESFAGYRFAAPLAPNLAPRANGTSNSTSYKPGMLVDGGADIPRQPTVLESIKRTFSKPK
jgi:hypothetical protein